MGLGACVGASAELGLTGQQGPGAPALSCPPLNHSHCVHQLVAPPLLLS